jgi:hypothetical protein
MAEILTTNELVAAIFRSSDPENQPSIKGFIMRRLPPGESPLQTPVFRPHYQSFGAALESNAYERKAVETLPFRERFRPDAQL